MPSWMFIRDAFFGFEGFSIALVALGFFLSLALALRVQSRSASFLLYVVTGVVSFLPFAAAWDSASYQLVVGNQNQNFLLAIAWALISPIGLGRWLGWPIALVWRKAASYHG